MLFCSGTLAQAGLSMTGTFSNFAFSMEGGDLNGVEIRILMSRNGARAILQFADGGPGEPVVVPISIQGDQVRFAVPKGSGEEGTFTGRVSTGQLVGDFEYARGGKEHVILRRQASYWDRPNK